MPTSDKNLANDDSVAAGIDNDGIDAVIFDQILELDESEEEREFSKPLVYDYLAQAKETFVTLEEALESGDLKKLSELGHYLKGSSATIGLVKVKEHCEKIQRFGRQENNDGSFEADEKLCLERITETLKLLKADFGEVEKALRRFFEGKDPASDTAQEPSAEVDEAAAPDAPATTTRGSVATAAASTAPEAASKPTTKGEAESAPAPEPSTKT